MCVRVRVRVFLCEGGVRGCRPVPAPVTPATWQDVGFIRAVNGLGAVPLFGALTACFQLMIKFAIGGFPPVNQ